MSDAALLQVSLAALILGLLSLLYAKFKPRIVRDFNRRMWSFIPRPFRASDEFYENLSPALDFVVIAIGILMIIAAKL
jgi:hypothetical protein